MRGDAELYSLMSCAPLAEPNLPAFGSEMPILPTFPGFFWTGGSRLGGSGQEVMLNHRDTPLESCFACLPYNYRH